MRLQCDTVALVSIKNLVETACERANAVFVPSKSPKEVLDELRHAAGNIYKLNCGTVDRRATPRCSSPTKHRSVGIMALVGAMALVAALGAASESLWA
jgi:hypothetical protein